MNLASKYTSSKVGLQEAELAFLKRTLSCYHSLHQRDIDYIFDVYYGKDIKELCWYSNFENPASYLYEENSFEPRDLYENEEYETPVYFEPLF